MMPFFTMSPTSRMSPMNDDTFSGVPVTSSSTIAPTNEIGAATSTTSGSTKERNCNTITAITAAAASASTASIDLDADCWPAYWAGSSSPVPGGGGVARLGRDRRRDPGRRRVGGGDCLQARHHGAEGGRAHVGRHRDHLLLVF